MRERESSQIKKRRLRELILKSSAFNLKTSSVIMKAQKNENAKNNGQSTMQKRKLKITRDRDVIEYVKTYAGEQKTSVSEIFAQFILNLKRTREDDPTELILSDPDFMKSLMETISDIRKGKTKWYRYEEVF